MGHAHGLDYAFNPCEVGPQHETRMKWMDLIRSRAPHWKAETRALAVHFDPEPAPEVVRVVVGNQGGEDAFTADPSTIVFDVASKRSS